MQRAMNAPVRCLKIKKIMSGTGGVLKRKNYTLLKR
jgi:hypothetical protein